MKKKDILTFIIVFLALNFILSFFNKPSEDTTIKSGEIGITTTENEFNQGSIVTVEIKNSTDKTALLKNECPQEPLNVLEYQNSQWVPKTKSATINCENTKDITILPGEKTTITYNSWNHALFGEIGRYKISADIELINTAKEIEKKTIESPEFQIKPQGFFSYVWTTFFFQPLYNILIFLINTLPGKSLALGIILLTILIRTILLIPNQKALKAQRKLQEVQPKLNKIREKHKDNQEAIARETMNIWKEHKVSPFGSCLPMLIQFPVLIALYYVIQSGLNPDNAYLLYNGLKDFPFDQINAHFFNLLDLTKINYFVLPLIVGGLQFFQMKLALMRTKSSNKDDKNSAVVEKDKKKEKKSEMEIANSMMIYIMPVMIAFFTASVPAGVGLYWAVSTIYGIAQQYVVNYQIDQEKVKVKVLN